MPICINSAAPFNNSQHISFWRDVLASRINYGPSIVISPTQLCHLSSRTNYYQHLTTNLRHTRMLSIDDCNFNIAVQNLWSLLLFWMTKVKILDAMILHIVSTNLVSMS